MRVELRDSLEFFFPDSTVGRRPCRSMTLDVARGGTIAVHLLLNDLDEGSAVRVCLADSHGVRVRDARWFRLIDVPVEANTGPVGFAEKEGEHNPHVIRRAPFRVYDAMAPMPPAARASGSTMGIRLHLVVPPRARPDRRAYTVRVQHRGDESRLSLVANVHKAVIPPIGRESWPYTNWFNIGAMATRHGRGPWSEGHWRMIGKYAALMAHGRQNTFRIPWETVVQVTRGVPRLDVPRLRRIVKTFTRAGLYYIEGGHAASRSGGEWGASTFDIRLCKGLPATSAKGNAFLARLLPQFMAEIDRNGWRDRWLQHVADEPAGKNAADYRILSGMIRKYMPGVPILDATMSTDLAGAVDIWCPQCQEYQRQRDQCEAQRALGDKMWFYVCCFPGGPWLNRCLDQELLRPLLFGWAAARYDLDGFLHYGLNHYLSPDHPYEKTLVKAGKDNFLPPGDGHVVYPGPNEPWSGLRFEAQREGTEDLELLRVLKERNPRRAEALVRKVIRRFDDYTKDVRVLRRARRELLAAW